jgi:hypothetical protein
MYVSTTFGMAWQVAAVIGFGVLLLVFHAQNISRRRLIASVCLMVLAVGCAVYADGGDLVIYNYCKDLEPWSAAWILGGCWALFNN